MKFSVVTLNYNQLSFLKEQVKPAWDRQTFKDFEWILATDGSTDGTQKWAKKLGIKSYNNPKNTGFGLIKCLNAAAKLCKGNYIVWVMGDTYPRKDFLERLNEAVGPDRMVNGIRISVLITGARIGEDWRVKQVRKRNLFGLYKDIVEVKYHKPWELMTLNTMCMPMRMFEEMGGIYTGYKGYGQMDSDMAAWAFYKGYKLFWQMNAIAYHLSHSDRPDSKENQDLLHKRLEEFAK